MNPADSFKEVDLTFHHSKSGGDRQELINLGQGIKAATLLKAMITDTPDGTINKPTYKINVHGDGWSVGPTIFNINGLYPKVGGQGLLVKGTPCYVIAVGDLFVIFEVAMLYWLNLADDYVAAGANRMSGYAVDGPQSSTTGEVTKLGKININAVVPYIYPDGQTPTAGVRYYGVSGKINKGANVPFYRYDLPITNLAFSGNPPLAIPADTPPVPWTSIGAAMAMSPFPYGSGKYLVCQIIDDLAPGTLGFDDPKFRTGAITSPV